MSVLLVSLQKVKDPDKLAEYRKAAGPMVRAQGGELLAKSDACIADLHLPGGQPGYDSVVIFRFPDMESLQAWHDSDAYQAIVPLREEGAEAGLLVFQE